MLRIRLLGQFAVRWNGDLILIPSRPAQSLFAYLALNAGLTHRREKLYGMFWPDSSDENARGYLRSALWRIRKSFDEAEIPWGDILDITDIDATLKKDAALQIDADRILERGGKDSWTFEQLSEILALYEGELLPGFYDEWVVLERERIHAAYEQKMRALLDISLASQLWEEALEWGERWIAQGFAPEAAYQALMIAHAGLGDSSSAVVVYRRCQENLGRELGVEPSDELRALRDQLSRGEMPALASLAPKLDSPAIEDLPPVPGESPYKGLAFFDTADAGLFFGRESLTARLVRHLQENRFLAIVVGASGSGKSSLVRAGLIPALKRGTRLPDGTDTPPGSSDWEVHVLNPGAHPLETLALHLTQAHESLEATNTLIADFRRQPRNLHLALRRLSEASGAPRVLLVIDQFEEVFTLCRDDKERRAFIRNLMAAVDPENDGPTTVIITLRADFYSHCAEFPKLRQALTSHQEYIGAMSTEELRRAIEQPAKQGGWVFQSGLIDLLIRDVRGEPGALPLLSHALLETWKHRRGRTMTLKGYAESGAIRGAIARTAEAVIRAMDPMQRQIARGIFIRLTELGAETQDTRRRALLTELVTPGDQEATTREVLNTLAEARLVTLGEGTAEVAHEALIREWPTLRTWLEEDRQGLLLHRHLTEAAQEWEARGRDAADLYRGARLAQASEWAADHGSDINPLEGAFLAASQDQAAQETAERKAQQARELEAAQKLADAERQRANEQRRSSQRLRWFAAALSVMLLIALVAAGFALQQRNRAESEALASRSRELASAATVQLDRDPELSALLSLEAVSEAQASGFDVPRQVEEVLRQSVMGLRTELVLAGHKDRVYDAAYSPDGTQIATASGDGYVRIWDASSGELLKTLGDGRRAYKSVAFRPDGTQLAASSNDRLIYVWELPSWQLVRQLEGHTTMVQDIAYGNDGSLLASVDRAGVLILWNTETGQPIRRMEQMYPLMSVALSPDNSLVAAVAVAYQSQYLVWETSTGDLVYDGNLTETCSGLGQFSGGVSFRPDGKVLVVGDCQGSVSIISMANGETLHEFGAHTGPVDAVAFSPDGERFVTLGADHHAKLWDANTLDLQLTLLGHRAPLYGAGFSPSGSRLVTSSEDGTARVWNVALPHEVLSIPTAATPIRIAYSPDGSRLAVGYDGLGTVPLFNSTTGALLRSFEGHAEGSSVSGLAFSPDGSHLASSGSDNTAQVWRVSDGSRATPTLEHDGWVQDISYQPDGRMLYSGGIDTIIRQWDPSTGGLQRSILGISDSILSLAVDAGGKRLAAGDEGGLVNVLDISTQSVQALEGHGGAVFDVEFLPGQDRLASASADGTIRIWDLAGDSAPMVLAGHDGPVLDIAPSPDGALLASASLDGTVRLWDSTSGRERLQWQHPGGGGYYAVAFAPDGERLAASGSDGVYFYFLDLPDVVDLAHSRLTRDFTYDECAAILPEETCQQRVPKTEADSDILPPAEKGRVCLISDAGGVYDGGYGQLAYEGLALVHQNLGWDSYVYEPEFIDDFPRGMQMMARANCSLSVAPGFTYGTIFEHAARNIPQSRFLALDVAYEQPLDNLWGQVYAVDQAAFLAGYTSASVTQTGIIGTFGGIPVPSVTDFMVGFEHGMDYYNQTHDTDIRLLGWSTAQNDGEFVGDFCCPPEGHALAGKLIDQGADVIMPVAGPWVGFGALQAVVAHKDTYFIGVDVDQVIATPSFADVILTSVEKRLDVSMLHTAQAIDGGNFAGGTHVGTLANGEVGLSPFYDNERLISESVLAELEQIKADIAAGKIKTKP
jgi:WD40 repeat protein/basic membrane lipoprotein Med (substrate-binding protein (PBP1-ABC) superfamily)/DNA-binding SARP family transcriptional activator